MIYAIVLHQSYATAFAAMLEHYLLPTYRDHPILYASAIDYTPWGMVATVKALETGLEIDLHLPREAVAMMVSAKDKTSIGFLADEP